MRLLAFVLVALQLGVAPVLAVADPPPTPVQHADHLGNADDPGCQLFHDDAACLACRVLFAGPMGGSSSAQLPFLGEARVPGAPEADVRALSTDVVSTLQARAPPIS